MWVLLDRKLRLTLLVILAVIALRTSMPSTEIGLLYRIGASLLSAVGTVALLIAVLGPSPLIWKWSLRLPFMARLVKFPDVNGIWVGLRTSSFLSAQAAQQGGAAPPADVMRLTIRQSWLSVRVDTASRGNRTISSSVFAFPEITLHGPRIWSTYTSKVQNFAPTEAEDHKGAAVLNVAETADRIWGTYFSDRGIAYHLPSSGRFNLRHFSPDSDRQVEEHDIDAFARGQTFQP
jgi:hypothetical protein